MKRYCILKNIIVLLLLALLLPTQVNAQKVGLVLSGGGAKGIAHVGLIKVLEDNGIPIDYVAGTSMGAIVAGLYAAGYSPEDMLELFSSNEFRLWSTGRLDKDDLYYFKCKEENPDWVKLDIKKQRDRIKLVLPLSLVPERQMDFAFLDLMAGMTAACNSNFDSLVVPFRCVSSDIYNKRAIVHKDGDLGEAIRASMTFPIMYKPIEKDGVLLFDGGIFDNFPVDVMQSEFNPDIIIGHIVSDMGMGVKPDPDNLIKQIETMVVNRSEYNIPEGGGIVMESKLDEVSLIDFQKVDYIYGRGVETSLQYIDSIMGMIQRRVDKEEVVKKREEFNNKMPDLVFKNVQVEGVTDNMQRKYIIQSIKGRKKTITIEELRDSYFKLIADEHIKSIRPIAYYNSETGFFDLHLKVESRKPFDVEFGGHISTRANSFGFVELNYKTFKTQSYTLTSNFYFGKFYNSVGLGGRFDVPSSKPFYLSGNFVYSSLNYLATSSDLLFSDVKTTNVNCSVRDFLIEGGVPFSRTGSITGGLLSSSSYDYYYQTDELKYDDKLDRTKFSSFSVYAEIKQKKLNFKQYPTEGRQRFFNIVYVAGKEMFRPGTTAPINEAVEQRHNYIRMKGSYEQYFQTKGRFVFGGQVEGYFSNVDLFSNYTSTLMHASAFEPLPSSKSMYIENFRANQYLALGGKIIYKFNGDMHLRAEAYGMTPIRDLIREEDGRAHYDEDNVFNKYHFMGLLAFVYQTPIGPLSVEWNMYDKPGQKSFFSVNLGYMLFNNSGFSNR